MLSLLSRPQLTRQILKRTSLLTMTGQQPTDSALLYHNYHKDHKPFEEVEASRPDFDASQILEHTKSPDPKWKPGQGLSNISSASDFTAESPFRTVDPSTVDNKGMIYKMMISAVTPRPIAFCSTKGANGRTNLLPSRKSLAANNHGVMPVDYAEPSGYKDTAKSIIDTGEFCVSLISDPLLEASNYCAIDAPEEIDEWKLAGLTQRTSETVSAPHVAESAFSMECKLAHKYVMHDDSGRETGTAFFGRITRFHVKEFALDKEDPGLKLAPEKLRIVSRLGGITYGRTISGYEIPRPQWEKAKDDPDVQKALVADVKKIDAAGSRL